MFRFKWLLWVGLGFTKAYKYEQYNTRIILDPNETFDIIFSDQRNVVNRCSNSTSLFVAFDLRTLCVIIWITPTKYVILLMFHTQWVCLYVMIKKEQFFKGGYLYVSLLCKCQDTYFILRKKFWSKDTKRWLRPLFVIWYFLRFFKTLYNTHVSTCIL